MPAEKLHIDLPPHRGGMPWQGIVLMIAGCMLVAALFIYKDRTSGGGDEDDDENPLKSPAATKTEADKQAAEKKANLKPEDRPLNDKTIGFWAASLKDRSSATRRDAAMVLANAKGDDVPAVVTLVVPLLKAAKPDVRQLSAYVLGNLPRPDGAIVLPALAEVLHDPEKAKVRRAAAMAMVNVGRSYPDELKKLLKEASADKDPDVRVLAHYIQSTAGTAPPVGVVAAPPPPPPQ